MFGSNKFNCDGYLVVDVLIGVQVVICGDVEFSGGLYVEGIILGKVIVQDGVVNVILIVVEYGMIEGEICVQVVVISGCLDGDVYVIEWVELILIVWVIGNIYYQVVEMNVGVQLIGCLIYVSVLQMVLLFLVDEVLVGNGKDGSVCRKLVEVMV